MKVGMGIDPDHAEPLPWPRLADPRQGTGRSAVIPRQYQRVGAFLHASLHRIPHILHHLPHPLEVSGKGRPFRAVE